MRTTDSDIITTMESATRTPYCQIIIVDGLAGPADATYKTTDRLIAIDLPEEGYGTLGTIILDSSDAGLDALDFTGRRIRVGLGYNTVAGDKSAELQPYWVVQQNLLEEAGARYLILTVEDIFTRMASEATGTEDGSTPSQAPLFNATVTGAAVIPNRTKTIETIIDEILDDVKASGFTGAGIPLSTYSISTGTHTGTTSTTVLTDSAASFITEGVQVGDRVTNTTDSPNSAGEITARTATTITVGSLSGGTNNEWRNGDAYKVQDSLFTNDLQPMVVLRWGTPVLSTISKLMDMTFTRLRMQKAGDDMEAVYITDTRTTLDYTIGDSGKIQPISISVQKEILKPNRLYVVDIEPDPGGVNKNRFVAVANNTESSDRYGILAALEAPSNEDEKFRDQAEATDRASALQKQMQADTAVAIVISPVNPFLELYDYIKVNDSTWANLNATGYINKIRWILNLSERFGPVRYEMEIHLGGLRKYFTSQFTQSLYDSLPGEEPGYLTIIDSRGLLTLAEAQAVVRAEDMVNIGGQFELEQARQLRAVGRMAPTLQDRQRIGRENDRRQEEVDLVLSQDPLIRRLETIRRLEDLERRQQTRGRVVE